MYKQFTSSCSPPPLPSAESMRFSIYQKDIIRLWTNLGFPDFAPALVASGCALVAKSTVCLEGVLLGGDLSGGFGDVGAGEREAVAGGGGLESVTLYYPKDFQRSPTT